MYQRIDLIGYLGQEPEHRTLTNGTSVCKLSVATSESWKLADGTYESKTSWHTCICWRGQADYANRHLSKGTLVHISGIIQYRTHERTDGTRQYFTEIRVQTLNKLEKSQHSALDSLTEAEVPPQRSFPSAVAPTAAPTHQAQEFDKDLPRPSDSKVPF